MDNKFYQLVYLLKHHLWPTNSNSSRGRPSSSLQVTEARSDATTRSEQEEVEVFRKIGRHLRLISEQFELELHTKRRRQERDVDRSRRKRILGLFQVPLASES